VTILKEQFAPSRSKRNRHRRRPVRGGALVDGPIEQRAVDLIPRAIEDIVILDEALKQEQNE